MEGHVRQRGDKWYYSFEAGIVDGKRKRIERVGGRTKKEALTALRKALQEYENAGLHFEPTEITVHDYLDYWMKNYVELECRPNTIDGYKGIIKNHIKPAIGMYKLKSITPAILQEFINAKSLIGFSANHMTNIFTVLSGSFKSAVYPYQFIKENPMQYVKKPRAKYERKEQNHKIIPRENYKKIMERFPFGNTFHMALQIAYHTGLRAGEVTALTWKDIDLDKKTLTVDKILTYNRDRKQWYFGEPKTDSSNRTIDIGKTLVDLLTRHKKAQLENRMRYGQHYTLSYLKPDGLVYTVPVHAGLKTTDDPIQFICTKENGEVVDTNTLKYCSRVINYELLIDFNFHSLRHTHATMLLENGANIKDVQARLGHSSMITTVDTYLHVTEKMSMQSVDIFESALND